MFTNSEVTSKIECIRQAHLSSKDWHQEQLNFVPLRGSWFAQSEADFDLEEEIDKFFISDKKILLLLGDSGAGKSLYTQSLAIKLWKTHAESKPIPLWISLPSLKDPINHALDETLASYGFTAEQVEQLRKTQRFVFILDAYDEIRQLKNLYVSNQLDQWQCKIIITCRREYLYREDNYKLYFQPFYGEKAQHGAYDEIIIRPFNLAQIQSYIKQYVSSQEALWKEATQYGQSIEEIPGLKNLITSPFILKLTMEVLPRILEKHQNESLCERKRLTQAALYDVFVEQWFERQEQKLKAAKQIGADEDIKPEFWAYAKTLSQAMHERNVVQVVYEQEEIDLYGDVVSEGPWKKFFDSENWRTGILQTACLIREVAPHHYAFIHTSLLEYFLTRNLYENMLQQDSGLHQRVLASLAAMVGAVGSEVPTEPAVAISHESNDKTWESDYFNQRVLVKDQGTLQFLADRVEEQESFKESLFERVYASRRNPEMRIAAGNAITILNQARISFSGKDLHGVCIGGVDSTGKSWGADLSYAVLDSANLSGADLSNVYLFQAWLNNANLTGACMNEVDFGELPYVQGQLACMSQDESILATADNKVIRIYSAEDQQLLREFDTAHSGYITSISISADGCRVVSGSYDETIRLWDAVSGHCEKVLEGHAGSVGSVYLSADGCRVVSGSNDKTVRLWDAVSGHCEKVLEGHGSHVNSVYLSANGRRVVSGSLDKTVRLWDAVSGCCEKVLEGHTNSVLSVCLSVDGYRVVSGSKDESVRLWDTGSGRCEKVLKGHTHFTNCVYLSADGNQVVSGSADRTIRLWDAASGRCEKVLEGHASTVRSVHLSADGRRVLSGSDDRIIRLWDATSDRCKKVLDGHTDYVYSVCLSADGRRVVSGSWDKTVRLWDAASGSCEKVLKGHIYKVNSVYISTDGRRVLSGSNDKTVRLWDAASGCCEKVLEGHNGIVSSVYLSTDGRQVVSGSWDETIRLWDVASGCCLKVLEGHNDWISSVYISADGCRVVSGSDDRTIRLWDATSGRCEKVFEGHFRTVRSVYLSVDGRRVISGSDDNTVRLWDAATGCCEKVFEGDNDATDSVYISADGCRVVSVEGMRKTVRLWDVASDKCLATTCHPNQTSIGYSQRDKLVVSAGNHIFAYHIEENNEQFIFRLMWCSNTFLSAYETCISGVAGLSGLNIKLLTQRGMLKGVPSKNSNTSSLAVSNHQATAPLPTGLAVVSAKQGLFAQHSSSVNARNEDKQDTEKSEKKQPYQANAKSSYFD